MALHTFATKGDYEVALSISDDDGGVAVERFTVTVDDPVPYRGEDGTNRLELVRSTDRIARESLEPMPRSNFLWNDLDLLLALESTFGADFWDDAFARWQVFGPGAAVFGGREPDTWPFLATRLPDGTLRLNIGPHGGELGLPGYVDGDDHVTVIHRDGTADDETVEVIVVIDGTSYRRVYADVARIAIDGGKGDDVVVLQGVETMVDFEGGAGENELQGDEGGDGQP